MLELGSRRDATARWQRWLARDQVGLIRRRIGHQPPAFRTQGQRDTSELWPKVGWQREFPNRLIFEMKKRDFGLENALFLKARL